VGGHLIGRRAEGRGEGGRASGDDRVVIWETPMVAPRKAGGGGEVANG
jgi:hypothetical protein